MAKFRINGIPQSIRDLKTVSSTSGAIATFDTDLTENLVKCVANIQAVQSGTGTPSPQNVRSISGWQNVNVVNMSDITNLTYFEGLLKGTHDFVDLGSLSWTSSTYDRWYSTAIQSTVKAPSSNTNPVNAICSYYDVKSHSGVTSINNTIGVNISGTIYFHDSSLTGKTLAEVQTALSGQMLVYELETPTIPTITVEQFNALLADFNIGGCLVQIALGQTVYGGYLDVLSGVLTITHKKVKVSDYTWYKGSTGTYNRFYTTVQNEVKMPLSQTSPQTIISDSYATASTFNSLLSTDKVVAVNTTQTGPTLNISDDRYTTPNDFSTNMANTEIVFELATPTTVQISSNQIQTILGQNNILADTGDIEVEFLETVGNKIA